MSKANGGEPVRLPVATFGVVRLKITGESPLLCNRINTETEAKIDGRGPATRDAAAKPVSLPDLAYTNAEGQWVFPGGGIKKALVEAARPTPLAMVAVRQIISVMSPEIVIEGATPRIVTHTARKDGKSLIRVQRAEFPLPWVMQFGVSYVEGTIAPESVEALAALAGFSVGIGCWRPECNGEYGKFSVESIEAG